MSHISQYTVHYSVEDGEWVGLHSDWPMLSGFGETMEEALHEIGEAVKLAEEDAKEEAASYRYTEADVMKAFRDGRKYAMEHHQVTFPTDLYEEAQYIKKFRERRAGGFDCEKVDYETLDIIKGFDKQ